VVDGSHPGNVCLIARNGSWVMSIAKQVAIIVTGITFAFHMCGLAQTTFQDFSGIETAFDVSTLTSILSYGRWGRIHLMRPKNPRPKGVVMNGWLSLS